MRSGPRAPTRHKRTAVRGRNQMDVTDIKAEALTTYSLAISMPFAAKWHSRPSKTGMVQERPFSGNTWAVRGPRSFRVWSGSMPPSGWRGLLRL